MTSPGKHTPGPWVAEEGDGGVGFGDGAPVIATGPGTHIAWLTRGQRGQGWPNARLIAAAPDHALVCWAMCAQDARWEEWSEGKGEFCFAGLRHATTLDEFGCPVLTDHLRALLAKATGDAK